MHTATLHACSIAFAICLWYCAIIQQQMCCPELSVSLHVCRFGTLALRVRTARFFQAVFAVAVAALGWAVYQLDYARQFR